MLEIKGENPGQEGQRTKQICKNKISLKDMLALTKREQEIPMTFSSGKCSFLFLS